MMRTSMCNVRLRICALPCCHSLVCGSCVSIHVLSHPAQAHKPAGHTAKAVPPHCRQRQRSALCAMWWVQALWPASRPTIQFGTVSDSRAPAVWLAGVATPAAACAALALPTALHASALSQQGFAAFLADADHVGSTMNALMSWPAHAWTKNNIHMYVVCQMRKGAVSRLDLACLYTQCAGV